MEIRVLQEADREAFDRFHASHPWGDLLQSWAWGDLKAKSGVKPNRCAGFETRETGAAASLLKRKLPRVNRCILYASRGPTWDASNATLVKAFTDAMVKVGRQQKAILIKIDPPIGIEDHQADASIRAAGFRSVTAEGFGGTQPKCVMQLDLDKSPEDLLNSFKGNWQYNIRLTDAKGVAMNVHCGRDKL